MATRPLPARPDLDRLRRQARDLQRDVRSGARPAPDGSGPDPFPLHLAQLALAREYGFSSWARLRAGVQQITRFRHDPLPADPTDELGAFCVEAVLAYDDSDAPARRARARQRLADHPDLVARDVAAACVATDPVALAARLRADPTAATTPTGPLRWVPLLYLTYSRLRAELPVGQVDRCVTLLLDAGADPNAGFFLNGYPTPFTALTGVFGSATAAQPRHPQQDRLAVRLLAAGADPNDGQALYNRMFEPADDHLELLFAHGLGTGDGGVWHRRLPEITETPAVMLTAQLASAVQHGLADRIRLLAAHGVDLHAPIGVPRLVGGTSPTPLRLAVEAGQRASIGVLRERGASVDDPESDLLEALLDGAADRVDALDGDRPGLLPALRRSRPALVLRAAVAGRPDAVRLLAARGFDVNAYGRQDSVIAQEWETALHHAAGEGKVELVALLLELGADPTLPDRRFGATPLGWAQHLGHPGTAALLTAAAPPPPGR